MKYVNDLIERSQINGDRGRVNAAVYETRDLGSDSMRRSREVTRGRLIAKSRSHSAPQSLESYLHRVVQTVVAGIVTPKRNNGANAIVLYQRYKRFSLAPIVRAKPKDIVAGDGERGRCATLANHKNIMRVGKRFDHSYFRTGL